MTAKVDFLRGKKNSFTVTEACRVDGERDLTVRLAKTSRPKIIKAAALMTQANSASGIGCVTIIGQMTLPVLEHSLRHGT